VTNVHIELDYPKNNAPAYTQPKDVFGQTAFNASIMPPLSSHDSYLFVEQNMGLVPTDGGHTTPPPSDTTKPTVSVTSPTASSTVTSTVNLTANASDNVAVSSVGFYLDNVLLSTDTTSPYSISWNSTTVANGTHAIYARAVDTSGNPENSSSVTFSVNNPPPPPPDTTDPTVSLTSPTPSSSVSGTITVSANASDTQSAIASVSYYLDSATTPFSVDVTSPYNSSWNTASVANGSHTIRAVARDTAGREGSTTVTFTVNNTVADTTDPTTSITDPTNGATVNGTKVVLATASDNVGVARVELLIDGTVRATDTTSPYSFNWVTTGYTDGAHTIQTQAYDSAGRRGTSSTLTITVRNTTTPPPTPKPGDVGGDGVVDGRDASIVLFNWNKTGLTRAQGDLNNDGVVNAFDISIILFNWGR
jgi:YD repeat-containing protein